MLVALINVVSQEYNPLLLVYKVAAEIISQTIDQSMPVSIIVMRNEVLIASGIYSSSCIKDYGVERP